MENEDKINHAQKTRANATQAKSGGCKMQVNKEGKWIFEKGRR
jgi:hypothetical protein